MNLADEVIDSDVQHVCLFGGPKSGKTQLMGNLAKHFKLKWFDLESGYHTLRKLPIELQRNIDLIRIPDTRTFPIAAETMTKIVKSGEYKICVAHGKVTCLTCQKDKAREEVVNLKALGKEWIVIFDSGTQLANSVMAHITKNQKNPDLPEIGWDEFKKQGFLMDLFLSELQNAPYNLCFATHEAEVEMEDGKKKLVPVAGTANFSRNTAKYFGHVVYCEMKNREHKFGSATTYSMNVLTGSRTDARLEDMKEVSLDQIFRKAA